MKRRNVPQKENLPTSPSEEVASNGKNHAEHNGHEDVELSIWQRRDVVQRKVWRRLPKLLDQYTSLNENED